MAKKKRLSKAEKQKRENLKWVFMFVILVLTITVYLAAFIESDKTQASIDFASTKPCKYWKKDNQLH